MGQKRTNSSDDNARVKCRKQVQESSTTRLIKCQQVVVPMENAEDQTTKQECDEWYSLFEKLDVDHDGFIPVIELKSALVNSANTYGLSSDETGRLIHNLDRNKDNYIDFQEFIILMTRAKKMRMRRVILYAALSVLPRSQQKESMRYMLQYNCLPPPIFLVIISLVQIGFYIYYAVDSKEGLSATKPVPTSSPLILNPHKKGEVWRYFTYMFLHIGYVHLLCNLVVQILIGIPLELVHKFWRIAPLYILGVMSGALLFFAANRNIFLAGASGGVYTLLSAHIANVIINWEEMEFNWIRTIVLSVFVGSDIGLAVYTQFIQKENTNVSYISHIGGFVAGLLLGIVILRNLRLKSWEQYAYWISLGTFVVFVIGCVIVIVVSSLT